MDIKEIARPLHAYTIYPIPARAPTWYIYTPKLGWFTKVRSMNSSCCADVTVKISCHIAPGTFAAPPSNHRGSKSSCCEKADRGLDTAQISWLCKMLHSEHELPNQLLSFKLGKSNSFASPRPDCSHRNWWRWLSMRNQTLFATPTWHALELFWKKQLVEFWIHPFLEPKGHPKRIRMLCTCLGGYNGIKFANSFASSNFEPIELKCSFVPHPKLWVWHCDSVVVVLINSAQESSSETILSRVEPRVL